MKIRLALLRALVAGALFGCHLAPTPGPTPQQIATADSLARVAVAAERSLNPARLDARTIGVVPLRVVSKDTSLEVLGYGLAALLYNDLSRSRQVTLVERLRTDAVIRELGLAASGAVDSATAPRVGNLAGARRLVLGTLVANPGEELTLDTRIADVASGESQQGTYSFSSVDDVLEAEKALALRIFTLLGVTLTPAERAAIEERPTRNLAALLAYSRGVRAEVMRDYAAAARQYSQALRIDPRFRAAREGLGSVQPASAAIVVDPTAAIQRASMGVATAVNRPLPAIIGTAADAPLAVVQQLVTITVRVRTP